MLPPVSHSQKERLAFLGLWVYFFGDLRRGDLETRFSIKPAAASRDINAYRALAPANLVYDRYVKAYVPTEYFRPVFGFSHERVLSWLLTGFGDGQNWRLEQAISCDGAVSLVQPDFGVLAELTRAIHAGRAVQIHYLSLSSGIGRRLVAPVALTDNGLRWHLRAYDRVFRFRAHGHRSSLPNVRASMSRLVPMCNGIAWLSLSW